MNQVALRAGLTSGLICVAYNLMLYLAGMEYFFNQWLALVLFAIIVFFQFYTAYSVRRNNPFPGDTAGASQSLDSAFIKSQTGYLSYAQAFLVMIIVGVVSIAIVILYTGILFNLIDTDLAASLKEVAIERTIETMEKWNVGDAIIAESVTKMDETFEDNYKPVGLMMSFLYQSLFMGVLTALFALIPKRTSPKS